MSDWPIGTAVEQFPDRVKKMKELSAIHSREFALFGLDSLSYLFHDFERPHESQITSREVKVGGSTFYCGPSIFYTDAAGVFHVRHVHLADTVVSAIADPSRGFLDLEDEDHIHFSVNDHGNGYCLVTMSRSSILASRWLAYVTTASVRRAFGLED
jgi:hypothetical protein